MIEVFQPPRITREETAYKMLFHVFAAFAALAVSMAGLRKARNHGIGKQSVPAQS